MKWHVNPETGEVSKCSAQYSCPFGSFLDGHADTKREAAKIYENFRSGLFDPRGSSYFYFIQDTLHEQFTQGDCGDLAAELHRLTGYPLVALGSSMKAGEVLWDHVAVLTPDGRILDVTGVQPESSTILAWGYDPSTFQREEISLEEINVYLGNGAHEAGSEEAKAVALQILERLKG